ncbi:ATP-dependent RNA helicase dbp7 [Patellaria atrata CBS 101060]|uniref:ATP-dependent RNA helicase n=1 Tax=Patellaria atrata CBS 101060 TaxID=1346257 RepID=A0A9P4SBS8_9PEZI|nr:ATP-dependent RNA helicase dbp7 [Patellaria atrata CBS 101060]
MADDGMLLNFSVGEGLAAPLPSFKGGHWKDRLSAKRAALHRQSKVLGVPLPRRSKQDENNPNHINIEREGAARGAKRARLEYNGDSTTRSRVPPKGPPKQIISSLFTYNPQSTVQREVEPEDGDPVQPTNAPLSGELETFTSLGLSPVLASHLMKKMDLKAPTGIQKAAVTHLLKSDSDAFMQAETGSGKTLAYLLPLVQRLMDLSARIKSASDKDEPYAVDRHSGLFAIILAPTRELSKQISVVLENLLRCAHWIVAGTVLGGEKKKSEKARLRKGLNILVATPGRLADHLSNTEALDVSNVRWLILDEGDRLMELGFEQEIQKIVSNLNLRMKVQKNSSKIPGLPSRRTTVLCSATMKMDVQRLGEISLKDAVHFHVDPKDRTEGEEDGEEKEKVFSAPAQLKQSYAIVPAKQRLVTLVGLLKRTFARKGSVMKSILFLSCADSVDFHYEVLSRGLKAHEKDPQKSIQKVQAKPASTKDTTTNTTQSLATLISTPQNPVTVFRLHGSLPQATRTSTLAAFTNFKTPALLVCTDVASRGLDLPNVDFVIEYDPPFSKEDHLHRIGRTARAGRDGRALIFLQPGDEEGYVSILKEGRHDGGKGLIRHDADEILKKGFGTGAGQGATIKGWQDRATAFQLDVERWTLESPKYLEMARRAYQSHIRAYATHVAAERHMFNIKTLHLGHWAKTFGLRDKPGSIRVPGMRPGNEDVGKTKAERKSAAARESGKRKREGGVSGGAADLDVPATTDVGDAIRRMRAKMKEHMGAAGEFNLG